MTEAVGRGRVSQRVNTVAGSRDFRGVGALALNPDGTGVLEATPIALAAGGSMLGATQDSILIGIEAPGYLGLDPFLHPHGVVNAASLSPAGNPVAPDTFVSLYGNGLGGDGTEVRVNDASSRCCIRFAAPGQRQGSGCGRCSGSPCPGRCRRRGIEHGHRSHERQQPGGFHGPITAARARGMITHADYSLVNAQAPARRGEIVLIWATGLGVEQPAPRVLIGGVHAEVLYAGRAPELPRSLSDERQDSGNCANRQHHHCDATQCGRRQRHRGGGRHFLAESDNLAGGGGLVDRLDNSYGLQIVVAVCLKLQSRLHAVHKVPLHVVHAVTGEILHLVLIGNVAGVLAQPLEPDVGARVHGDVPAHGVDPQTARTCNAASPTSTSL